MLPSVVVIPSDLVEGFTQVQVLMGNESIVWLKAYVTPLKLMLFFVAVIIAIASVVLAVRQRRRERAVHAG
ncbi:MAG: hypothetical protein AAF513_04045 [Pseudomonadota bacterium]